MNICPDVFELNLIDIGSSFQKLKIRYHVPKILKPLLKYTILSFTLISLSFNFCNFINSFHLYIATISNICYSNLWFS